MTRAAALLLLAALVATSACSSPPEPAVPTGPNYEGYLRAVEGFPFASGPYGAREAACYLKDRPDMTRGEAIDFIADSLTYVQGTRKQAELTIDAIDRFNMCPGSDWEW